MSLKNWRRSWHLQLNVLQPKINSLLVFISTNNKICHSVGTHQGKLSRNTKYWELKIKTESSERTNTITLSWAGFLIIAPPMVKIWYNLFINSASNPIDSSYHSSSTCKDYSWRYTNGGPNYFKPTFLWQYGARCCWSS